MTDLDLDRIARAATVIDPVFLNSPQYVEPTLAAALGRPVLTKVETLNPLRSFKGRGADFLVSELPAGTTVVCASSGGNFGQGIGYAARRHGLRADVFVSQSTSPVKLARMAALGVRVHQVDDEPAARAEEFAAQAPDRTFVYDGRDAAIAEGAGTIGIELLRTGGFDTVVLPLGDGALVTGVARWLKEHAPDVRIIGVGAATAPALAESWRTGAVLAIPKTSTFPAGIAIDRPAPEAVRRTRELVDDMVLVSDEEILAAMHLAARTLGVLLEPAGASGLAAIANREIPGDLVATVLTGANVDLGHFADLLLPVNAEHSESRAHL